MAIKGDLLSADLSNVFQMLALNRKRGLLVVREQGNVLAKRRLYIAEDRILLDEAPRSRPLVPLMVEMGLLTYEQSLAAATKGGRYGVDAVQVLRQHGDLTPEHMEEVTRRVEEEEILEVFLWRNVSFTLDEGGESREGANAFSLDHLIMEAARRQDEWRHVVETGGWRHRIHARTASIGPSQLAGLDAVQRIVLDHVDGVRGSHGIMHVTGLPRYFVEMALKSLAEQGIVVALGLLDLITTGDRLVKEGRTAEGIRLFRSALQFDRQNLTIHNRLARAYLDSDRVAKAAAHYRFCAKMLLASGHVSDAIAIYQTVLKLLPTDFGSLELCTELLTQSDRAFSSDDQETLEQARKLLQLYLDLRFDERALRVAELLHTIDRRDEELLGSLGRLRLRLGQAEGAGEIYAELASLKLERQDLAGALDIYRTMTGLEGARRFKVQHRIQEIQKILRGGRKRRRRTRAIVLGTLVLTVLVGGYAAYCVVARWAFDEIPSEVGETIPEVEALAARYGAMSEWFPLTPAAAEASELAASLRSRAGEKRGRDVAAKDGVLREEEAAVLEASRLLAKGRRLLGTPGRLMEAQELYQRAVALGVRFPERWSDFEAAKKSLADIDEYVSEGKRLLREAITDLEEGRRDLAFQKRITVLKEYRGSQGSTHLELPLELVVGPQTALVSGLSSGPKAGSQRFVLSPSQSVSVTVEAPGYTKEQVIISSPHERYATTVILGKPPVSSTELREPIIATVECGGSDILLVVRNGKLIWWNVAAQKETARIVPPALLHVNVPPLEVGGALIVAAENGLLRCVEVGGKVRWEKAPFTRCSGVLEPVRVAGDVLVASKIGEVVRVRTDGTLVWRKSLPAAPTGMVATADAIHVILATGKFLELEAADGSIRGTATGEFRGTPAVDRTGRVVAIQAGSGLIAPKIHSDAEALVLLPIDKGVSMAPTRCGDFVVIGLEDRLLLWDGARAETVWTPERAVDVTVGQGQRAAIRFASGALAVLEMSTGAWLFKVEGAPRSTSRPLLGSQQLVVGDEQGTLRFIPLQ